MRFREIAVAGYGHIIRDSAEKVERQLNVNEHVRILAPVYPPGALREFVPDHARFRVLVFENEFEFLAGTSVLPSCQQSGKVHHSVSGEKPIILRPTRLA